MKAALPIIVINLDRVPDRMKAVLEQFRKADINEGIKRFSAVDAQRQGFTAPGYAPGSWRDRWALELSEQAIFSSHREAWKVVAEGTAEGAVICEDDIVVSHSFGAALKALDIERYGVIKLDGFSASRRYGPEIEMGSFMVRDIIDAAPSAACYSISKVAARKLLENSVSFCATLDDYLFEAREGLHPVQLFPAVAVQGMCCESGQMVPEAIGQSERTVENIRGQMYKGPLLYRSKKELTRAFRRLARRLYADRSLLKRGGIVCRPQLADDLPRYKNI